LPADCGNINLSFLAGEDVVLSDLHRVFKQLSVAEKAQFCDYLAEHMADEMAQPTFEFNSYMVRRAIYGWIKDNQPATHRRPEKKRIRILKEND
jgi:hypothetical protein